MQALDNTSFSSDVNQKGGLSRARIGRDSPPRWLVALETATEMEGKRVIVRHTCRREAGAAKPAAPRQLEAVRDHAGPGAQASNAAADWDGRRTLRGTTTPLRMARR